MVKANNIGKLRVENAEVKILQITLFVSVMWQLRALMKAT